MLVCTLFVVSASPAVASVPDDNSVTTAKIVNGAVKSAKIANSAVGTSKIRNRTVTTNKLKYGAVTTDKIADSAVTTAKIADSAVTTAKIADSAVTTAKIAAGAVGTSDIADEAVSTAKIADSAITTAKIASSATVLRLGSGYAAGDTISTATMTVSGPSLAYTTGGTNVTTTVSNIKSVMIVPSKSGYVFEIDDSSFTTGFFKVKAMYSRATSPSVETSASLIELTNGATVTISNVRYQVIGQ
ncbi:MAG: hypothetical protein Q8L35_09025 [Actinomycetota bacterium]|nr:hypothetical protein [Actinomycetota bacterium]